MSNIMEDIGPRCLEDFEFSAADIKAIMEIGQNSSPGMDGVPAILLHKCAEELSIPIYLLWRTSLDTGKLPSCMKTSIVIPVFKSGKRCLPENYRPVSLTSHLCKVFERVVIRRLSSYLDEAGLYNEKQHGFRKGRSCLSQLLEHHQEVLDALENDAAVDVVYLDFAKAFDKVDHSILLRKLNSIGISFYGWLILTLKEDNSLK